MITNNTEADIIKNLEGNKLYLVKNDIEFLIRSDISRVYKLNRFITENYSNRLLIISYAKVLREISAPILQHFEKTLTFHNKKYLLVKYEKHIHKRISAPNFIEKFKFKRYHKSDVIEWLMTINPNYEKIFMG